MSAFCSAVVHFLKFARLFEVLCAARKASYPIQETEDLQMGRLINELSKREVSVVVDDEFKAFSQWIVHR